MSCSFKNTSQISRLCPIKTLIWSLQPVWCLIRQDNKFKLGIIVDLCYLRIKQVCRNLNSFWQVWWLWVCFSEDIPMSDCQRCQRFNVSRLQAIDWLYTQLEIYNCNKLTSATISLPSYDLIPFCMIRLYDPVPSTVLFRTQLKANSTRPEKHQPKSGRNLTVQRGLNLFFFC